VESQGRIRANIEWIKMIADSIRVDTPSNRQLELKSFSKSVCRVVDQRRQNRPWKDWCFGLYWVVAPHEYKSTQGTVVDSWMIKHRWMGRGKQWKEDKRKGSSLAMTREWRRSRGQRDDPLWESMGSGKWIIKNRKSHQRRGFCPHKEAEPV
jgi:hypothetical protein